MIKNEGQKLGFSIAEEMAKRDKIKIKSPDYLKFNKPK